MFLDVWQSKDLRACFSDVWQLKDLAEISCEIHVEENGEKRAVSFFGLLAKLAGRTLSPMFLDVRQLPFDRPKLAQGKPFDPLNLSQGEQDLADVRGRQGLGW